MISPIQPAIKELEAAGQAIAAVNHINGQFDGEASSTSAELSSRGANKSKWARHMTMTVRGPLVDRSFVPEPFRTEDKTAIEQRRAMEIHSSVTGPRRLMLLIGEIKEFGPARSGRKVVIKHMPGFPLFIDQRRWKALQTRFSAQLELGQANEASHLMAINDGWRNGLRPDDD